MRDIIDERNERERISKSIIKYWNVNYMPRQPEPENSEPEETETEPEVIVEETEEMYNKTTGAYSGTYGRREVKDEVTKGQIKKILEEKSDSLRSLIDENRNLDGGENQPDSDG